MCGCRKKYVAKMSTGSPVEQTACNETCTICLESLNDNVHTLEDCGHRYHVGCIMKWFRSGYEQCPLCRSQNFQPHRFLNVDERARLLRRHARKRNAPKHLKRAVKRLRDREEKQRQAFRVFKAFRDEHRDVIQNFHKLEKQYFRSQNRTDDAMYELGISEYNGVVVPLVTEVDATTIYR